MLYHGTSLSFKGVGIFLRGKSGSGKADLALRLIHHGAILIADDQTDLIKENGKLQASCPKELKGKLEVRGIGIVDVPFLGKNHPIDVIIDLIPWKEIERFPEKVYEQIENVPLPLFQIDPFENSAINKIIVVSKRFRSRHD